MAQQHSDIFQYYLKRFKDKFGDIDFGQPVKNEGYLVRKLTCDEFMEKYTECRRLENFLRESMSEGNTLSDAVEYEYRELCASVLEKPKDFKLL